MRRSFVLVFVTLLALAPRLAAAQNPPPKAIEIPVQVTGAAAGTLVELYLNNGKNAELVVDVSGIGNLVLNMGNSGKTKLTLYVDVCKDGKIVKMIFTDGEPPPKDEDCERRVAIAGFYNDCAKLRVTFDVSKLFGHATGCSHTMRNVAIAGGGALIGVVALTSGGGGDGYARQATQATQSTQATMTTMTPLPPVNNAPPANNPPPTTPPATTPPSTTPSTPSAAGTYMCAACNPSNDPGRHDGTLRACFGLTAPFTVTENPFTIRSQSGFIEVTGANYNPSTGAFDITGRGSIAGFNNVTVRATGTVNTSTGRITMNYTLGTNGEFPGGQPITYSVTLQKQ